MAQISYGTITITDTNDIESIIIEYARNQSTSSAPTSGWSTKRPTWAQDYYIWQRTRTHKAGTSTDSDIYGTAVCITGSTGQTGGTGAAGRSLTSTVTQYTTATNSATITQNNMGSYTWNSNVPSYSSSTPAYWVRVTNTYSNPSSTEYIIYKDNGLTDAIAKSVEANNNAAIANSIAQSANENAQGAMSQAAEAQYQTEALAAKVKHYWWDSTGAHIASGINGADITEGTASTYGFNSLVGLASMTFGYNSYKTVELDGSVPALKLYKPSKTAQGALTATLDSNGLVLSEGGVKAGTAGQSGFIYLSTKNYGSNLTINNHQASNWREIIGTKFGVDADGNLYASNAVISGTITVGSGSDLSAGLGAYSTTSQMNSAISTATNDMATKTYVSGLGYQTSSDVSGAINTATSGLASKGDATYRTQRIYRRYTTVQSNLSGPTTWVTANTNIYNNWTTKIPPLTNGSTKYPYLYTCVQKQTITQYNNGSGTGCTCTSVLLDDTTTVIDGGSIIAGSVTANEITGSKLSAIYADMGNITAGNITKGYNSINFDNSPATLEFKNNSTWATATKGIQWTGSDLNIKGNITATSLTIGGTSGYNGIDALNITGYTIEILQNSSHSSITNPTENIWIYPVLYHNNNPVTVSDKTAFIWYKDDSTTGIAGNATDGGILGVYGSTYRVTYTFADGAVVDGASPVQTVTVSDITHITEVNSTGIRVHPSSGNHYIQIDSAGLEVVQGGTSVAKYGTTARIGTTTGSRFLMNSNSLQAYNSSGTKYFEVTSSGLTWGSNTAATTSQLAEVSQTAAQTATNFIKIDGNGIKIQNSSDATDYLFIDSSKIALYRNNIEKLQLTDSLLRLGDGEDYLSIDSSKIALYRNSIEKLQLTDSLLRLGNNEDYLFIDSSKIALYRDNIEKLQLTDSLLRLGDSNNYVSVDSDSLDIYNNQTRLATFHSEGAEIGENSTTAKIGFNKGRGSITARDLTGSTIGQYDLTFGIDDTGWGSNYYALVTGLKARKVMSNTDESVSRLDVMANNNGAYFDIIASHPQYNSSGDDIGSAWPSISGTTENTGLNGVLNLKVYSTVAGTIESEGIEVRTNINSARTSKTTYINFTGNYITFNGTTIHSSDKRLKTHINYLGKEAIDFISALHPAYFFLKEQKITGFYAQEVECIDPWNCFVNEDTNGYKTLNYIGLIAPLVTYCQHLEKRITELETQLEGGIN